MQWNRTINIKKWAFGFLFYLFKNISYSFWNQVAYVAMKIAKRVFYIYIFLLCLLFLCSISMSFFVPLCSTSRLFVFNNQFVFIVGEKSFWWSTQPIWILHLVCVYIYCIYRKITIIPWNDWDTVSSWNVCFLHENATKDLYI